MQKNIVSKQLEIENKTKILIKLNHEIKINNQKIEKQNTRIKTQRIFLFYWQSLF